MSGGIGRQKYRTGTRIFTYLFRILSQELDKDEHGPHVINVTNLSYFFPVR